MEDYKYWGYPIKDLLPLARDGDEDAYKQLFYYLKPIIFQLLKCGYDRIPIFDTDDYLQEGYILLWEICRKNLIEKQYFVSYYRTALRHRFLNLYADYCRKNFLVAYEKEGSEHNIAVCYVSGYIEILDKQKQEYTKAYRSTHRVQIKEQKKRYWRRHKPEILEKQHQYNARNRARINERTREYHRKHKDEIADRRKQYYAEHRDEINAARRAKDSSRREEINARQRAYWAEHREKLNESRRARDAMRRDEINARQRAYRAKHKDELNARRRAHNAERRKKDIVCE